MTDAIKINRRKWHRVNVRLPAQYFIKDQSTRYMECTIINLSRSGAAVLFPSEEALRLKSAIFLELMVPKTCEQLTLKGELRIKYKNDAGLVSGIQFSSLLPEDMFAKLT